MRCRFSNELLRMCVRARVQATFVPRQTSNQTISFSLFFFCFSLYSGQIILIICICCTCSTFNFWRRNSSNTASYRSYRSKINRSIDSFITFYVFYVCSASSVICNTLNDQTTCLTRWTCPCASETVKSERRKKNSSRMSAMRLICCIQYLRHLIITIIRLILCLSIKEMKLRISSRGGELLDTIFIRMQFHFVVWSEINVFWSDSNFFFSAVSFNFHELQFNLNRLKYVN